jgi:cell division protein FtsL
VIFIILGNHSRRIETEDKQLPKKRQPNIGKVAVFSLIALGVLTLIISVFYTSSFLALLGFALVFWSAILLYLTPTKHVFIDLLSAAAQPGIANIETILDEYNLTQKGIYIPTKSGNTDLVNYQSLIQNKESCLVFLPETQNLEPSKLEEDAPRLESSKNGGIYITPPGEALCKLFEQQAGISFNEINLQKLQSILPKVLTEGLEFVETIDIQDKGNIITVELTQSIFERICHETNNRPRTHEQVGCLLTSAIACALAKATGKLIIIEKEAYDQQNETKQIEYKIVTKKAN